MNYFKRPMGVFNTVKRLSTRVLWWMFHILLLLLAIFTYVRTKVYFVPSASMEDTLQKGDIIWTKKFNREKLQRGDILVFLRNENNYNTYFVKRCTALPGDTLFIENGIVSCNSINEKRLPLSKNVYQITLFSDTLIREMDQIFDFPNYKIQYSKENNKFKITLQQIHLNDVRDKISSNGKIGNISQPRKNGHLYPWSNQIASSFDNFGPVVVPKKGTIISLTGDNIIWYKPVIESEKAMLPLVDNTEILDNNPTLRYTFKRDYLFMMGDNRHNSRDSRVFGFIPVEDVQAKAIRIFISIAEDEFTYKKRISLRKSLQKLE